MVRNANPRLPPGMTSQGSYVIGADGTAYAWDNYNRDPRRLNMLLDRGLAGFRQQPPGKAQIAPEAVRAAALRKPDPSISVARVFTRVRPMPPDAAECNNHIGRDTMWIFPEEARELLAASGPSFPLPRSLAARMVLFQIIDNVKGQSYPWRPDEVSRCRVTARPLKSAGGVRSFTFSGEFAKAGTNTQFADRGIEGTLQGEIDVDEKTARVTRFRAVAESTAWETLRRPNPAATPPAGKYPLKTAFIEAGPEGAPARAREVPPAAAETGEYYRRAFVAPAGR